MRLCRFSFIAAVFVMAAFSQTDRGTITGTVTDPAGSVVPRAAVTIRNPETGALYETITTDTGNYLAAQLPAALYEMTVSAAGFNRFIQKGIRVEVAQTARIDVAMTVGSTTDSVTITADAPLLKTDSSDVSTNLSTDRVEKLPLYGARPGDAGIRSPFAGLRLVPGATLELSGGGNNNVRVNGMPNNTYQVRVEGQESTDSFSPQYPTGVQPGVDALEEVSFQTSNYAAEYGQVGGGLINFTSKSGTNKIHGNLYEYLNNEALNAGNPFTNDGRGHLVRPKSRVNDYGGSVGGPVFIPHVYNGHNKTFFFFNIERTPGSSSTSGAAQTVPTLAFRNGDFSSILTGRVLGIDPLGNNIYENTIYDPSTRRLAPNGQVIEGFFPGNKIPVSRFDPVAVKIQALFPLPVNSLAVNNWVPVGASKSINSLTTFKIDHNINDNTKASFYFSWRKGSGGSIIPGYAADGIPYPITTARDGRLDSPTVRFNVDRIVNATTVAHLGFGFIRHLQPDVAVTPVLQYDAPGKLGLVGGVVNNFAGGTPATGFPQITGLNSSFGGAFNIGPTNSNLYYMEKPTAVVSLSKVHENHSLKFGAEWRKEAFIDRNVRGSSGNYAISNAETALPSTDGQNLNGGAVGFPYASFLLGAVDSATVSTPQDPQVRKTSWGAYAQDSWKVTRRISVDYGLRWDYQTALTELHDRLSEFSPSVLNPAAGNLPGAMVYAGTGTGRVGGEFTKTYPYAFGPRLGLAWQLAPKTVLRAGAGLTYSQTSAYGYITNTPIVGNGYNQLLFTSPSYGQPAVTLQGGLPYTQAQLYNFSLDPGIRPAPGQISSPPYWLDPNGGRPGRIAQWNVTLQRELTSNLSIEVGYVGNRSVWDQTAQSLDNLNALTPARITAAGLNITSAADRSLLTSRLDSALAAARGFSNPPYAGFPLSATVAQSLRPFPQFSTIPVKWSPLGKSWYDSLQAKLTKRLSHGLEVTSAFTWQKELTFGDAPVNNVFNLPVQKSLSPSSLPFILATAVNYEVPKLGSNRWLRAATGDWEIGVITRYQSGLPILAPASNNALNSVLFQSTFENRVPGQPLFLQDLNCHCFDPNRQFVLNPKAWTDAPAGQFGSSAVYYNDYRNARRPDEELSVGRTFRIREGMNLSVRGLFYNVFNRTYLQVPDSTNAQASQVVNLAGAVQSGFGRINTQSPYFLGPRNGRLEARFVF